MSTANGQGRLRGLRTNENPKFRKYFDMVQKKAEAVHCVYFLDCGQGREIITEELDCEDISGWLVPTDKADECEKDYMNFADMDKWDDWYTWAEWDNTDGLKVNFVVYG